MKKRLDDDLPAEVDFSNGVRGKYAGQILHKTIYVPLDDDVSRAFTNREQVNAALRKLIQAEDGLAAAKQKAS